MLIVAIVLLMIIIFVVFIVTFRYILTQNVVSATKHLEVLNEDFSRKEQEINKQIFESKQKAEEAVTKARDEAEREKAQIIKDAENKREIILQEAHNKSSEIMQQAEKSRQLLILEMEERISKRSVDKACELAHLILPDEYKKNLHAQYVEELTEKGLERIERLRIPENIKEVSITMAFPLDEKQLNSISKKLKKLISSDIKINQVLDPKIAAGVIIIIGSLVLDASLKNKIREESRNLDNA